MSPLPLGCDQKGTEIRGRGGKEGEGGVEGGRGERREADLTVKTVHVRGY